MWHALLEWAIIVGVMLFWLIPIIAGVIVAEEKRLRRLKQSGFHEGPPRVFVPICKHPRDYQITIGPLGYEEIKEVVECPLLVERPEKP